MNKTYKEKELVLHELADYDDLKSYLSNNSDIYTLDDIEGILAQVPGCNDEDNWHWILSMKDGSFIYTSAWCDYTGWDCQSGGSSERFNDLDTLLESVPESEGYTKKNIRENFTKQTLGEQPYCTYVERKEQN